MKKVTIFFLFAIALSAFSPSVAFWGNPIPGISVVIKRNPGGIVVSPNTDETGKFSGRLKKGRYELTMSYDSIIKEIRKIDNKISRKESDYEVSLSLDPDTMPGVTINGKAPQEKLIITRKTGVITINVSGDTAFTGIIGFAIKEQGIK